MTRRALLFGSQTYGLAAVNADVELMRETLEARGFEVRVQVDDQASRAAMIEGYERLIEDTETGSTDPVVVYYSGHGGHTALDGWEDLQRQGRRSHLRYLVPFDMGASTETDFRGLLSEELSDLQRRLTEKAANVTTILDCCHSGTMSRDPDLMPKSAPRSFPFKAALPLLAAIESGRPATGFDDSNPLAVRLVACDPLQSAYERASVLGGRHGALTEQLVLALRELGDRPVTWRVLGDRLRRAITTTLPQQRPEVEGPTDRLLFSLRAPEGIGALRLAGADGRARIEAAGLLGVSVGDRYELRDAGGKPIGPGEVDTMEGGVALLTLSNGTPDPARFEGALAVPVRTTRTKAVQLELDEPTRSAVAELVAASSMLHVASDAAVARIADEGGLVVRDAEGFLVQERRFQADRAGMAAAVALVERVARAERLRSLDPGDAELLRDVQVELRSHDEQGMHQRAVSGERLYPGEKISYRVTNRSARDLYIGLFDIDTAYGINLVSSDEPSGWRVPAGQTKVVGGPDGLPLVWDTAQGVPEDGERPETFLTIASTTPQSFPLLTAPAGSASRGGGGPTNVLDSLLEEAGTGTRGWSAGPTQTSSYCAKAIDFFLVPGPKPDVDEPPFAIRDVPDAAQRSLQPRSATPPVSRLAVRLVNLKVRDNKALFKAAVRVDALILTAGDGQVVATPFTQRFPGVADGDLLPADNLLLYHGAVQDFLDIAIWANRDDGKGEDLAALFEQHAGDPGVQGALTVLGGLVLAAPPAAAAVAAVAAVATVVRVGASLVSAAVGKEIGLYRTSFLPFEQFGLGRQPSEGLRTANGIEFAYEVVDPG